MLKSLYSLAECVISWSFFRYMNYIKTFLLHMVNFWRKLFIIKQLCLLLKIMTTETIQMDLIKSWHSPVIYCFAPFDINVSVKSSTQRSQWLTDIEVRRLRWDSRTFTLFCCSRRVGLTLCFASLSCWNVQVCHTHKVSCTFVVHTSPKHQWSTRCFTVGMVCLSS